MREQSTNGVTIITSKLPIETFNQTQQIMHEENIARIEQVAMYKKKWQESIQEFEELLQFGKSKVVKEIDLSDKTIEVLKAIIERQLDK